jgi:hypothetical protein
MTVIASSADQELLELGLSQLRNQLPDTWAVETAIGPATARGEATQHVIVKAPFGSASVAALVEVRQTFSPQDARRLLGAPIGQQLRAMAGNTPIVVISRYLSPRTRELLEAERVSYIDLSGNIRLELQNLFVAVEKVTRNPSPTKAPPPGLRGAMGGRVLRVLVDARPPYALTDIAKAAGVDGGYTSRILDALSDEALIEREPRGKVTKTDWPALLRARAHYVSVLGSRAAQGYVSPRGTRAALNALSERPPADLWAITGSFAAAEIAPVAAPALLVLYAMNPASVAADLGLLPADDGANVVLIRPSNYGPFDRTRKKDDLIWAGVSQVVLDCLSGNGRMPAEGEALIEWMTENEPAWRVEIDQLPPPAGTP